MRRRGAALLAMWLLAGCATVQPPLSTTTDEPALAGRLSLRVQRDGDKDRLLSARFELEGSAAQGRLLLDTPIGTRVAEASWGPDGARLVSDRGSERFADLDALAIAALGEPVPLAALHDWLRGRPWRGAAVVAGADRDQFVQGDWQVSLGEPGWITVSRLSAPPVSLRVRLDDR